MSAHKVHSPSSASRRRLCPGSLAACKGEPNRNSVYAAEGTAYHFVASSVLERLSTAKTGAEATQGGECADWVGMYVHVTPETCYAGLPDKRPGDDFVFKIDEENARYAQVYVDAMLRRKLYSPNVIQMYEVKLDTSLVIGVEDQGGTGDCVTLDFDQLTIFVDDLKFGKGKPVAPFWVDANGNKQPNDQCAEYGAAALRMFRCMADWKKVVVGIHMPRMFPPVADEMEMSVEDLDAWVANTCRPYEQVAHKLYVSGTPEEILANLKPSTEACTFCPLDKRCKAQTDAALAAFPIIQQPNGPVEARQQLWQSTDQEFLRVLNIAEEYVSFFSEVFAEGLRRKQAGASLPGWKVVLGNKGRRALNQDAVLPPLFEDGVKVAEAAKVSELLGTLGDDAYAPREFLTASKLDEKLNKKRHPDYAKRAALWQRLQGAISQADGQPQLVREGDARPSYARKPELEFDTVPTT